MCPNRRALKRHTLNLIEDIKATVSELERFMSQRDEYVCKLSNDIRTKFLDYVNCVKVSKVEKKLKQLNKGLCHDTPQVTFPNRPENYVFNLSDKVLNQKQLEVLSLGMKFCPNRTYKDRLEIETQFEMLSEQLTDLSPHDVSELESLKSTFVDTCFKYNRTRTRQRGLLDKEHIEALKDLAKNKDYMLSKPDKGSGVVILNTADYDSKLSSILSDASKFQLINGSKDLTESVEKQLAMRLKDLKDQLHISSKEFFQLKPTGSRIPRLYGLPKIHKQGVPLRPILDMVGSPYHELAKWLAEKLKPLRECLTSNCVRDTFDFVDRIKSSNVKDKRMLSLDVNSLFTNVPLIETIDYVCSSLEELKLEIGLPSSIVKELLLRCTMNVQFLARGNLYRQVDGVAMGSPLGPLLADIFMAKLENGPLKPMLDSLPTYVRYVDDTFIICNDNIGPHELLNVFNDSHKAIKFTVESEIDGCLPFLDVLLTRQHEGHLTRTIYRKPTWTGQYTSFHSFVPLQMKRNLIKTLAYRARRICSKETLGAELHRFSTALAENRSSSHIYRQEHERESS